MSRWGPTCGGCCSCSSGGLCSMSACSFASGSSRTPRSPWRRGWGAAVLVLAAVIAVFTISPRKAGKDGERDCALLRKLSARLHQRGAVSGWKLPRSDGLQCGTIRLKRVVNTEKITRITAQVYISETYLPQGRKPYTENTKERLCYKEPGIHNEEKGMQVFHGTGVPFLRCEFRTRREPLLFLLRIQFTGR